MTMCFFNRLKVFKSTFLFEYSSTSVNAVINKYKTLTFKVSCVNFEIWVRLNYGPILILHFVPNLGNKPQGGASEIFT